MSHWTKTVRTTDATEDITPFVELIALSNFDTIARKFGISVFHHQRTPDVLVDIIRHWNTYDVLHLDVSEESFIVTFRCIENITFGLLDLGDEVVITFESLWFPNRLLEYLTTTGWVFENDPR